MAFGDMEITRRAIQAPKEEPKEEPKEAQPKSAIDLKLLRDIQKIAGKLMEAFSWSRSKQGSEYWNAVHMQLIDPKANAKLPKSQEQASSLTAERRQKAVDLSHELSGAFIWSDTPQGSDFWGEVYRQLQNV